MSTTVDTHRLERNAVGLAPTLFQSITHMAPAAAVAFSIIVGVPYAGGSIPLAVLLALIACLFVAISIGQLARHLPSAGGLYTYSARTSSLGWLPGRLGLHPGRADRRSASLLDLRQRAGGQPEFALRLAPLVVGAVRGSRWIDRVGADLPWDSTLHQDGGCAGHLRDRRLRGTGDHLDRRRRREQHAIRLRTQHRQCEGPRLGVPGDDLRDPG